MSAEPEYNRADIARCLFNTAMSGHAQWDQMSEPNREDWYAKADAWIRDVTRLTRKDEKK